MPLPVKGRARGKRASTDQLRKQQTKMQAGMRAHMQLQQRVQHRGAKAHPQESRVGLACETGVIRALIHGPLHAVSPADEHSERQVACPAHMAQPSAITKGIMPRVRDGTEDMPLVS